MFTVAVISCYLIRNRSIPIPSTLQGMPIASNSYVGMDNIGNDDDIALLCHTDYTLTKWNYATATQLVLFQW